MKSMKQRGARQYFARNDNAVFQYSEEVFDSYGNFNENEINILN